MNEHGALIVSPTGRTAIDYAGPITLAGITAVAVGVAARASLLAIPLMVTGVPLVAIGVVGFGMRAIERALTPRA